MIDKLSYSLFSLLLIFAVSAQAQTTNLQMSESDKMEYRRAIHSRIPMEMEAAKLNIASAETAKSEMKTPLAVPEDMIFPNEADEVQAILMTWIYDVYTVSGNTPAQQVFDGLGIAYSATSYALQPVYSRPDFTSSHADIFAKLANGIQQHAQVWINIWNAEDSTSIKNFMAQEGMPLTNYRFFVNPGNSFWYRDCGPVAFYYGEEDHIGFADFEYYGGRPLDDKIAKFIGEQAGFEVFTNTIEYEGGNVLVDGVGSLFTSEAVYDLNADSQGLYILDDSYSNGFYMQSKDPLTASQVRDSLSHLMNLNRCTVLPALRYDGGTGHIDLYADMWDESTFVSTKHPASMAHLSDPIKVETNMEIVTEMESYFGSNYHNTRIPLPKKDDGNWYSSQLQYDNYYTRSFSNHTFVNDAIMQPVFYTQNPNSGDVAGNLEALAVMNQQYPGYVFEEIDVRDFDGYGGAIHCITKQIPAENPVRIYHDPIRWSNSSVLPTYRAIIQNKSGIASATLYYRNAGETSWNETALLDQSDNMYEATISLPETDRDTLEYYISATSNNGKTITKPMTAPLGFYKTVYGTNVTDLDENDPYVSVEEFEREELGAIGNFFPNPAQNYTELNISNDLYQDINVKIVNVKGQVVLNDVIKANETSLKLNTSTMNAGAYWAIFTCQNHSTVRKLIINR